MHRVCCEEEGGLLSRLTMAGHWISGHRVMIQKRMCDERIAAPVYEMRLQQHEQKREGHEHERTPFLIDSG